MHVPDAPLAQGLHQGVVSGLLGPGGRCGGDGTGRRDGRGAEDRPSTPAATRRTVAARPGSAGRRRAAFHRGHSSTGTEISRQDRYRELSIGVRPDALLDA